MPRQAQIGAPGGGAGRTKAETPTAVRGLRPRSSVSWGGCDSPGGRFRRERVTHGKNNPDRKGLLVSSQSSDRSSDALSDEICEETLPGTEPSPADQSSSRIDGAWVVAHLREQLTSRDWWVICSLYGLEGQSPVKPKEVAKQLGISRTRVDQIAQAAIRKSRAVLNPRLLQRRY